jgi:hypothetical protein
MEVSRELIPIHEVNIDIELAAERLHLGPQGELIQKIENFNSRYRTNIGINKKYGFKPGAYDQVKKVFVDKMLKFSMKPSNMFSLKRRIDDSAWMQRNYWDNIVSIQNMMHRLKHDQVGWQDNTEVLATFWNNFQERIPNDIANMLSSYPGHTMNISLEADKLIDSTLWKDLYIIIDQFIPDVYLEVYHQDEVISRTQWGHIDLRWRIPLWKYLNNFCEGGARRSNYGMGNPYAKIHPFYEGTKHPYVSSSTYTSTDGWITYTCTGDMQSDIQNAAWNIDIMSLTLLSKYWLGRYHIPRTNPLNRIEKCLYGWQEGSDKSIWKHRVDDSIHVIDQCRWPDEYDRLISNNEAEDEDILNPCDTCNFRDGYAELVENAAIPQDAEYPGQSVFVYEPCYKALQDYSIPETEDDCIIEAGLMELMIYDQIRFVSQEIPDEERRQLQLIRSPEFPMPEDATLELIYQYCPNFNFEHRYLSYKSRHRNYKVLDVLDSIFMLEYWRMAVDEYCEQAGIRDEGELDDVEYEFRNHSIEEVERLTDDLFRSSIEPLSSNTSTLTAEEAAIRWATQNGRTLNI